MIRSLSLGVVAAASVAGCASGGYSAPTSYPSQYPVAQCPVYAPPPVQDIYASAPGAPVFGELYLCPGTVSNSGPVGPRGESHVYTPYIYVGAETLLRNPTEGACLSSGFGYRGTATGGGRNHKGIDLANRAGGYIFSAGQGHIVSNGRRNGYGNTIEIDHGNGVRTLYGHMAQTNTRLRPGTWVAAGTAIGRMGQTGNASGIHLHYELTINGQHANPLQYGNQPYSYSPAYPGAGS